MKKLILSTAAVALVAGFSMLVGTGFGQTGQPQAPAQTLPHKVGLIDMAHVFKKYEKFEALREDLKSEMQQSDNKARQMAEQMKKLDEQMKALTPGSADYVALEKQLLQLKSDFEAFRQGAQRDLLRKESQIYKTVYLEATDAVQKFAYHYKYTLVMRFNREGLDTAAEPGEVLQRMNRQVVYHREEDDITQPIVDYLNKLYRQAQTTPAPAPNRAAQRPAAPRQ